MSDDANPRADPNRFRFLADWMARDLEKRAEAGAEADRKAEAEAEETRRKRAGDDRELARRCSI